MLRDVQIFLQEYLLISIVLQFVLLLCAAWCASVLCRSVILRGIGYIFFSKLYGEEENVARRQVIYRLVHIIPALVVILGVGFITHVPKDVVVITKDVAVAFIVVTVALALSALLNVINFTYERRFSAQIRPIKGYLQLIKIAIAVIAVILVIAIVIDRSPLILLSGLGAIAAVLMLVFQDTLLSFVASIQISSGDMVRIGDWIEMPQLNADGDVIDIALHTVKVQNWDKTITTVPTRRLITDPFKNWRGMQEAGGRRIKRAIFLDQNTVHFLSEEEKEMLKRFRLLEDYLHHKEQEIAVWNNQNGHDQEHVNMRRITNLGTFRAYVERYLMAHHGIHQDMTVIVRHLNPTSEGIPLEIYCFTNKTNWNDYEGIQADIFDHLIAILPEFGLQVYQSPSGFDLRAWGRHVSRQDEV